MFKLLSGEHPLSDVVLIEFFHLTCQRINIQHTVSYCLVQRSVDRHTLLIYSCRANKLTFRNSIDPKKAWSKEQNDKYQALIDEAKDLVNYFIHLEAEDGQGPYRLGLMILHGGFPEIELVNSSAAYYTETGNNSYMERISEIRLELDDLINNPNTKGD